MTPEQAQWTPPGTANPLGASYAHALVSEDVIINGMIRRAAPLRCRLGHQTGLSQPMPMPGPDWVNYGAWTHSVQVDLPALQEYGAAVAVATDEYLAGLTPEALDTPIDLSAVGMGQTTLGWVLGTLVLCHLHDRRAKSPVSKACKASAATLSKPIMPANSTPYTFRHPSMDDLLAVLQIQRAARIADYGSSGLTEDGLRANSQEAKVSLDTDAWLALTPDGTPVAYAEAPRTSNPSGARSG